jgi:hypothetical protein
MAIMRVADNVILVVVVVDDLLRCYDVASKTRYDIISSSYMWCVVCGGVVAHSDSPRVSEKPLLVAYFLFRHAC